MDSASTTFERIQREIRENIEREKELKNSYSSLKEVSSTYSEISKLSNGISSLKIKEQVPLKNGNSIYTENKDISPSVSNGISKSNGFTRRFMPNVNTKGVMQKFLKNRGKVSSSINVISQQNGFSPVRLRVQKGQAVRNGYIPAEEKIVKELLDFQTRESELRSERMKSQPDLMAALELEDSELCNNRRSLTSAKSLTNLYETEDISKKT